MWSGIGLEWGFLGGFVRGFCLFSSVVVVLFFVPSQDFL